MCGKWCISGCSVRSLCAIPLFHMNAVVSVRLNSSFCYAHGGVAIVFSRERERERVEEQERKRLGWFFAGLQLSDVGDLRKVWHMSADTRFRTAEVLRQVGELVNGASQQPRAILCDILCMWLECEVR